MMEYIAISLLISAIAIALVLAEIKLSNLRRAKLRLCPITNIEMIVRCLFCMIPIVNLAIMLVVGFYVIDGVESMDKERKANLPKFVQWLMREALK
jgi:Na+/glutamate symporter